MKKEKVCYLRHRQSVKTSSQKTQSTSQQKQLHTQAAEERKIAGKGLSPTMGDHSSVDEILLSRRCKSLQISIHPGFMLARPSMKKNSLK